MFVIKKPKGQHKVTQGSTGVKLSYLGSESHGGLNYQVSFISHQYFTSYPISKVNYHFFREKAINTGRSRRRGFTH